jgi:hypothetical protein
VDSIAENLLDAIDEEEGEEEQEDHSGDPVPAEVEQREEEEVEVIETFNEEADTSVFENWEVSWAPDFPDEAGEVTNVVSERASQMEAPGNNGKSVTTLSSAHRSVAFVVLVTLFVLIFSMLYGPVKSLVLSMEHTGQSVLAHRAQSPLEVFSTPLPERVQTIDEIKAMDRAAAASRPVPAVRHRPETKVTMLLLAPPALSTTRLSTQSRKSKVSKRPEMVAEAEAKAVTRGGVGRFRAKIRAVLHKCWQGVTEWFRANFFSRTLPQRRGGVV